MCKIFVHRENLRKVNQELKLLLVSGLNVKIFVLLNKIIKS
jgi:hypothetical protein